MPDLDREARLLEDATAANRHDSDAGDPKSRSGLKRIVPLQAREPLRKLATLLAVPLARRRARRLLDRRPLRLNIGSGFAPVDGWISIDLIGAPVDVPWDLARGIPFPDASVDAIFSEHVYEHLSLDAGYRLTCETLRALRPGGVVRIAVPNAGLLLRSYAGTYDSTWALSRATRMQAVMGLFYEHGHRTMYDDELLTTLLAVAGAADIQVMAFRQSRLADSVPDSEHRREGTLYVEASKPMRRRSADASTARARVIDH